MSSKPFDVTMKDILEVEAGSWPALLGPWPCTSASLVDADASTVTAAADKVLRVEGTAGPWLLDLEPEARHAADAPERMHLYATVLHHRHGLLVRSVLLLLRREANASNLTGELDLRFPDEAVPYDVFRNHVVRVWEMPLATILQAGLSTLPLAPLTDQGAADLPEVIARVAKRLREEADPETAAKLLGATYALMGLRYSKELINHLFEGVNAMEESTTYQYLLSKGEKKVILRQGRKKFGPPDEAAVAALEKIDDTEQLAQLAERLLEVSSWKELLATLTP